MILLSSCLSGYAFADDAPAAGGGAPASSEQASVSTENVSPLTAVDIQKALADMRNNLNQRIEKWGSSLNRDDFIRVRGKSQLKPEKQQEICNIFQSVVDDTYQLAVENKQRLSDADQKIIANRTQFVNTLGFQNGVVKTQMGFDCRIS